MKAGLAENKWIVERLEVGMLMVGCYIVGWKATGDAIVIDPGDEADRILDRVKELGLKVVAVVNTHGHGDHIGGNSEIARKTGAPIWIGEKDAPMLIDKMKNLSEPVGMPVTSPPADRLLKEGDVVQVGDGELKVLEAPGHSLGSILLVGDGIVFVGDVLFAGSIGRTDFPNGSLETLLKMIREKIFPLGDDFIVCPGHGPETTVGEEKRGNFFLQPGFNPGMYM